MKNRVFVLILSLCIAAAGASFAFADEGNVYNNLDKKYMSDYSTDTAVADDFFTPQQFVIELSLNNVGWLGDVKDKITSITVKTGAKPFKISDKLPNLTKLVKAQILAKASLAGNTFTCANAPEVRWDGKTGRWQTVIDAPKENISYALDEIEKHLTITDLKIRNSAIPSKYPPFFDNMIRIKAGTEITYGGKVLRFIKDCDIDELYDEKCQAGYYESTFAENVLRVNEATSLSDTSGSDMSLSIAQGSFIQICEKKFLAKDDIVVNIERAAAVDTSVLSTVKSALGTAVNTKQRYADSTGSYSNDHQDIFEPEMNDIHPSKTYYIHTCDADAVFDSGFGALNELIGVMAQKDAKITVVPADEETVVGPQGRSPEAGASVSAELKVISQVACSHEHKKVVDKIAPTVTTIGYSGDTYCDDCGLLLGTGDAIAKLPSSIKLSKTAVNMKTGKTDSSVKVTFVSGDAIKSVTSSNTSIVKAAKSGTNGIKLTALKKTGTATVTVKLNGGKSAKVTVKVTSTPCSKLVLKTKSTVTLKKGKKHQIKVTRNPSACVQKITYKSSNKKVASVTSKGKVTAKKKGKAKITIKCGSKTKTVTIKVK